MHARAQARRSLRLADCLLDGCGAQQYERLRLADESIGLSCLALGQRSKRCGRRAERRRSLEGPFDDTDRRESIDDGAECPPELVPGRVRQLYA